ncbi:hypothetical protein AGMMS50212_04920 [Spirochaetia bacterium]|nr:hypothetical protein AGMMS50212_04920 [Spirochaetia bacterium]
MKSNVFALALSAFLLTIPLAAQDLSLTSNDIWISQGADGGFHLFIRKKNNINSILLVETAKDPSYQEDNYAYRTAEWNAINGNELRILDGRIIPPQDHVYSLIDSTPEYLEALGIEVFHIYIPYIIEYGYAWTRNGEVYVGDGTYFNIRAFNLPYADYRGAFQDNSFVLEITQEPLLGPAEDNYMPDTVDAYKTISETTGGILLSSRGPSDLIETIKEILLTKRGSNLDLVFCIDTTASMENDIEPVKKQLTATLEELSGNYKSFRIGFVFFKDYLDEYITRVFAFNSDMKIIQRTLNSIKTRGGRDIPEAVYESLFDAAVKFPWSADERNIILIGDAPPHPRPRGKITKEKALNAALEQNIKINAIILPQ